MDSIQTVSPDVDQPADFTNLRALVVDDCFDDRLLLSVMLEIHGLQVTAVSSAAEAIATLPELRPDLMFSDLAMPFEDGYTLIRRVRSLDVGRCLPAIAVSALSPSEEELSSLAAGFQAYVIKPVEPQAIAAAIHKALLSQSRWSA
ncbi:response regulator [Microcoleus sp. FACHB-1515]|uniref:response regulator n=1 Tax=Cyanophyceae TaxID=3028117 RepID=UPI001684336B|nr:response regulator [Microcoleus sp. FACHB-1515]MBD2090717.1 response regulator [Microcoleus sp. FACHB-1515]